MTTLQLLCMADVDGPMLADWSAIARGAEIRTNEHGMAALTAFVPMSTVESFWWFDRPGLPWLEVNGDGEQPWRGRMEDVTLVPGGIEVAALGPWSVFGDVPYTDTPSSPEQPEVIVADILAAARAANPTLLSDSELLIDVPGVDVYDEEYTDDDMRRILARLAALGDDQTPPRQWEVGVWGDLRLYFRPRGTDGRTWYTDVDDLTVERSLSKVWNRVLTRYDGGITSAATDADSVARYGVTRERVVSSRSTDLAQAERERDAALADAATPVPRASVQVDMVYTASGVPAPRWMVRSGDTLVIRNLPADTGEIIDRIRTFRIRETRYSLDADRLQITPESPLPTLEVLLAQALETPQEEAL